MKQFIERSSGRVCDLVKQVSTSGHYTTPDGGYRVVAAGDYVLHSGEDMWAVTPAAFISFYDEVPGAS